MLGNTARFGGIEGKGQGRGEQSAAQKVGLLAITLIVVVTIIIFSIIITMK